MTADAWRGIAAEDTDQLTAGVSALLRRRARRLLTDLLRPHKRMVTGTLRGNKLRALSNTSWESFNCPFSM